jgi:hypothetical protein
MNPLYLELHRPSFIILSIVALLLKLWLCKCTNMIRQRGLIRKKWVALQKTEDGKALRKLLLLGGFTMDLLNAL